MIAGSFTRWSVGVLLSCAAPAIAQLGDAALRIDPSTVYTGSLSTTEDGRLALEAEPFGGAAAIDWAAIQSFQRLDDEARPLPAEPMVTSHDALTGLRSQRLHGRVVAIGEHTIEFDSLSFGRLTLPRVEAGALVHVDEAASDAGALLQRHRAVGDLSSWTLVQGAKLDGDTIAFRDFAAGAWCDLPAAPTRFELELSWVGRPEFAIVIGGDPAGARHDLPEAGAGAIVIEPWGGRPTITAWGGDLPVVRMADDVLPLDARGRITFTIDADEVVLESVAVADGEPIELGLAVPQSTAPLAEPRATLQVIARGRRMTFEQAWATPLGETQRSTGYVVLDRPVPAGDLVSFDHEKREIVVAEGRAAFEGSPGLQFLPRNRTQELFSVLPAERTGRVATLNGEAIEFEFATFEAGQFRIKPRWSDEAVSLDAADVLEIRFRPVGSARKDRAFEYRLGTARVQTTGFEGVRLDDGVPQLVRSVVGFASLIASPIDKRFHVKRATRSQFHVSRRKYPHDIVLRDGQTFPAHVVGFDEGGLVLRVPFQRAPLNATLDPIKAVLFDPRRTSHVLATLAQSRQRNRQHGAFLVVGLPSNAERRDGTRLTQAQVERALTVLRTQKDDPGTSLLVATNGDLLRTTVGSIADGALVVYGGAAGGGEAFPIPTSRIAAWIHVAPEDARGEENSEDPKGSEHREQRPWIVELDDRTRLLARLIRSDLRTMVFEHAVLGQLQVHRDEIQHLAYRMPFEPRVGPYMDWRTRPIAEPSLLSDR